MVSDSPLLILSECFICGCHHATAPLSLTSSTTHNISCVSFFNFSVHSLGIRRLVSSHSFCIGCVSRTIRRGRAVCMCSLAWEEADIDVKSEGEKFRAHAGWGKASTSKTHQRYCWPKTHGRACNKNVRMPQGGGRTGGGVSRSYPVRGWGLSLYANALKNQVKLRALMTSLACRCCGGPSCAYSGAMRTRLRLRRAPFLCAAGKVRDTRVVGTESALRVDQRVL